MSEEVKIYKCPRCVRKFTRKGLGVHFTKIHKLRLEDIYLEEEIDQAEVKVEKTMTKRGDNYSIDICRSIPVSLKRPSCELGKNGEDVEAYAKNENVFKCSKCYREFYKEVNLNQHVLMMHAERKFDCTYCHAKFKFENIMQRHQKTCTAKKLKLESVMQTHQKEYNTKSGVNTTFSTKYTIINSNENDDENVKDFDNVQTNQELQTDITIKEEPIESEDIKNELILP